MLQIYIKFPHHQNPKTAGERHKTKNLRGASRLSLTLETFFYCSLRLDVNYQIIIPVTFLPVYLSGLFKLKATCCLALLNTMTMTSIRFAGSLTLVFFGALLSVQGDAASSTPSSVKDLADIVLEATKANPKLRAADDKRKNHLLREFASASSTTSRSLEDGGEGDGAEDDYFSSNWNYNADMSNADYGFDLGAYSLKYTGCSTVETYNDQDSDESGGSMLVSKRFATFRLCPTNSCSSNRYEGCNSNYGDYVVSLDQFLAAMVALNEDRVVGYCQYCQECAAVESFHKFYYETTSKKTIVVSTAKQTYQSWYSSKGYGDDGYGGDGAALAYYKAKKSSSSSNYNSGNGYSGNGYNGGNSYNGGSSSSSSSSYNQWSNTRSSWNSGSSGSNSWSDMGQSYSSWYGKQVVNGHYNNGAFVEEWGYFSDDGNFYSLEEDSIEWDQYLYGTYPDAWDEDWIGSTADEVQSCNYQYSASCYNQYETCMRVLQDEDYMAYMEYVQSQNNNNYGSNSGMTSLADFLQCTQVDQDYIDQYQQYLSWQKAMASQYAQQQDGETYTDCEGDDDDCVSQYSQYDENYNNNNNYDNMALYIGPHCGEDGHTVTLGVYTDATCSTYTSKYSAKDILGVDVMKAHTGGSIELFPTKCISCVADVSPQDLCAVFASSGSNL
jgi:hypothetical protein